MDNQLEAIQEAPTGVSAADNRIATKFKFWPLIRFVLPTMAMSLFMALFKSVDDGLFVSQFVGKEALSAVNICFPLVIGVWGIAIMFATGGAAIAGKKIGEGKPEEARRDFSCVCIMAMLVAAVVVLPCVIFMEPIMRALGADESIMHYCVVYGNISVGTTPLAILSPIFEFFYVTSGAPKMGLISTLLRGAMNILFDYLFIVVLRLEVMGVALATAMGDLATCILGLCFYINKKHAVHFAKPSKDWGYLLGHSCKTAHPKCSTMWPWVSRVLSSMRRCSALSAMMASRRRRSLEAWGIFWFPCSSALATALRRSTAITTAIRIMPC